MSFEDELKELILGVQAREQGQNQRISDFLTHWHRTKEETVKPVLDQAARALGLHSLRLSGLTELCNGSVHLKVGPKNTNSVINELIFSPNTVRLVIDCTYKNPTEMYEAFTLDNLDRQAVERKIKEFLSAVLA
jgi:hypothetical protein